MFYGFLAALSYVLCLTASLFLFGHAVRRSSALRVTLVEVIVGLILVTLILVVQEQATLRLLLQKPSSGNWLYLGLSALFGFAGGNYFSLVHLKRSGEKLNSLLSPAITAAVVLLSVWRGGTVLYTQLPGIALTLTSVIFFLLGKSPGKIAAPKGGVVWSGPAAILCISLSIVFAIEGAAFGNLSIFHAIWIRLLLALPLTGVANLLVKTAGNRQGAGFWAALLGGVLLYTVIGNYLWFYASFALGAPLFQTVVATLPFFVYVTDVYLFKRTQPSLLFLITALAAAVGIALAM